MSNPALLGCRPSDSTMSLPVGLIRLDSRCKGLKTLYPSDKVWSTKYINDENVKGVMGDAQVGVGWPCG